MQIVITGLTSMKFMLILWKARIGNQPCQYRFVRVYNGEFNLYIEQHLCIALGWQYWDVEVD